MRSTRGYRENVLRARTSSGCAAPVDSKANQPGPPRDLRYGFYAAATVAAVSSLVVGGAVYAGAAITGAGVLQAIPMAFSLTSITVSASRVIASGGQNGGAWLDLGLDVVGIGILQKLKTATGLAQLGYASTGIGIDLFQGGRSGMATYESYQQGDPLGMALNGLSTVLGFAGAGFGLKNLRTRMAVDPTVNPLNYRLTSDTWGRPTLNSTGPGEFHLEYHGPKVAPATSPLPGSYINTRYTINMAGAPAGSATNATGFARNGRWFWRQMLSRNPELFSPGNAAAIRAGGSPVVDATWVAGNPTHQSFLGQKLIHHHIDQGGITTGLPESVHQAWHSILHPN